jgi:formylglycine-generating enzyme required for sulfatase activity
MGSPVSEPERFDWEGPQHSVTIASFYISKYEVTQKDYLQIMETNPSRFKGDTLPVEQVSWFDAIAYCNLRSQREGLTPAYAVNGSAVTWNRTADGYRLPTEAEWEYACRAGTTAAFHTGNSITTLQANINANRGQTWAVNAGAANPWGLYNMHGNVWEWCWDWYGLYSSAVQTDPVGAEVGLVRIVRGGSWNYAGQCARSAYRHAFGPTTLSGDLGFRLVRPAN